MDLFSIDNVNETDPEVIWSTYPAQRSVHFGLISHSNVYHKNKKDEK